MLKPILVGLLNLSAVLATYPLSATESQLSSTYTHCMDQSNGVTAAMLHCIGAETAAQDQRLNQNYQDVMAHLALKRQQQLREAQRAWLKYRDLNCSFYDDPDGGTLARVVSNDCFMQATARRALELQWLKEQLLL